MSYTATRRRRPSVSGRNGVALMVYLKQDQAARLDELSRNRRVTKTALVQFAVERLFVDMHNGQLDLPLGLNITGSSVRGEPTG